MGFDYFCGNVVNNEETELSLTTEVNRGKSVSEKLQTEFSSAN